MLRPLALIAGLLGWFVMTHVRFKPQPSVTDDGVRDHSALVNQGPIA